MKVSKSIIVLLLCFLVLGSSGSVMALPELETVEYVDVERYLGKWYSIAEKPQWFTWRCVGATAEYSLRRDGGIDVLNTCRWLRLDGPERFTRARAYVVDEESNARLEVLFFSGLVRGDYWIIDLGEDYEYAVVGEPDRNFLWILSREPHMDADLYDEIIERVEAQGYDTSDLLFPWKDYESL